MHCTQEHVYVSFLLLIINHQRRVYIQRNYTIEAATEYTNNFSAIAYDKQLRQTVTTNSYNKKYRACTDRSR